MKRILLLLAVLLSVGVLFIWAQGGLQAPDLLEHMDVYNALVNQISDENTQGPIVVYVYNDGCRGCEEIIQTLGHAGIFTSMKRKGVEVYSLRLDAEQRRPRTGSFHAKYPVSQTPTFFFFQDGKQKKRLNPEDIAPQTFKSALQRIGVNI